MRSLLTAIFMFIHAVGHAHDHGALYSDPIYGFTSMMPPMLVRDPDAEIENGSVFRALEQNLVLTIWAAPVPDGGLEALAQGDKARLIQAGFFVAKHEMSPRHFAIWATRGNSVLIQLSVTGADCRGNDFVFSEIYSFDREKTDPEYRLGHDEPGFPSVRFQAGC